MINEEERQEAGYFLTFSGSRFFLAQIGFWYQKERMRALGAVHKLRKDVREGRGSKLSIFAIS